MILTQDLYRFALSLVRKDSRQSQQRDENPVFIRMQELTVSIVGNIREQHDCFDLRGATNILDEMLKTASVNAAVSLKKGCLRANQSKYLQAKYKMLHLSTHMTRSLAKNIGIR